MKSRDDRSGTGLVNASFALILAMPLLMIAAREIPATILVVVTALLSGAIWRAGLIREARGVLFECVRSPAGYTALGLIALVYLSVAWSPLTSRGATHAFHFSGGIILAAVAVSAILALRPKMNLVPTAHALIAASTVLAADMWFSGELRGALDLSTRGSRLNRAAVAIVLLLPLVTMLLVLQRRLVLLAAVWVTGIAAVAFSVSYSAKLALIVVVLLLPVAGWAAGLVNRLAAIVIPGIIILTPVLAFYANDLVPERVQEAVRYDSLTVRGEIWRETVPFIKEHPVFGWGIEASHGLAHLPESRHLPEERRMLLDFGHPHNAPLQVWLELGLVGAAIAAAVLYSGVRALGALPPTLLPYATTTVIAAFVIACVSHGAWQAWWWALLGLIATAYAMAIAAYFPDSLRDRE